MHHEAYMRRCFELAQKGRGYVAPNPLVGSVIVHDNKIIGEGYHMKYGGPHAEVNAVNNVTDPSLLEEATIYVNLEPCAHHGKTPPCADMIISKNIPKVMIGCVDSFAEVSGKGIEKLKTAGCEVTVGVLQEEAIELNKRFFTFHNKKRPYIILKWAQSLDGYMDIDRKDGQEGVFWITAPETKALVHKWRHEEAGILVGANTILNDNPSLTVREIAGEDPIRFVVDPENKVNLDSYQVGKEPPATHLIRQSKVDEIVQELYEKEIQSVLVEGGAYTLSKFIASGLWDEARVLTGKRTINCGLRAPVLKQEAINSYYYGHDLVEIYHND